MYPSISEPTGVAGGPTTEPDVLQNAQRGESGTLRIGWNPKEDLNPLLDDHPAARAANDLIFDGLMRRDADGSLDYALAESLGWSDDGRILTIQLDGQRRFHDGARLDATDAALSLAFVWSMHGGPSFDPAAYADGTQEPPADETEATETEPSTEPEEPDDINNPDDPNGPNDPDDNKTAYPVYPDAPAIFAQLVQIRRIHSTRLECRFLEPVPQFPSLLTFPIIPASAWLREDPLSLIQGTGRYKMSGLDELGALRLETADQMISGRSETNNGSREDTIRTIVLKPYNRLNEAMRALESDELDLVLLGAEQYPFYYTRSNLNLQRFVESRSIFVVMNSDSSVMSNPADLLLFKQLLRSDSLRNADFSWPGELCNFPLSYTMVQYDPAVSDYNQILEQLFVQYQTRDDEQSGKTDPSTAQAQPADTENGDQSGVGAEKMMMILPDRDHLQPIGAEIAKILSGSRWDVQIQILDETAYADALTAGRYDLALHEAELPDFESPSWLYGPNGLVASMDLFALQGLDDYDNKKLRLSWYDGMWYLPKDTDGLYDAAQIAGFTRLVHDLAAKSPYSHLYMPYGALAFGDRISGQSRPNRYHPYEGIEELWVWSGQ